MKRQKVFLGWQSQTESKKDFLSLTNQDEKIPVIVGIRERNGISKWNSFEKFWILSSLATIDPSRNARFQTRWKLRPPPQSSQNHWICAFAERSRSENPTKILRSSCLFGGFDSWVCGNQLVHGCVTPQPSKCKEGWWTQQHINTELNHNTHTQSDHGHGGSSFHRSIASVFTNDGGYNSGWVSHVSIVPCVFLPFPAPSVSKQVVAAAMLSARTRKKGVDDNMESGSVSFSLSVSLSFFSLFSFLHSCTHTTTSSYLCVFVVNKARRQSKAISNCSQTLYPCQLWFFFMVVHRGKSH